jgi:hypothetical protein
MQTPMGVTASSSAGMAALSFVAGTNQHPPGLGFDWNIFGDVLEQGLKAAKPLINAAAGKLNPGSVLPYDPNTWTANGGGSGGVVPGTVGVGGSVQVGTNLSTGTIVLLGGAALLLVVMLTRGRR